MRGKRLFFRWLRLLKYNFLDLRVLAKHVNSFSWETLAMLSGVKVGKENLTLN